MTRLTDKPSGGAADETDRARRALDHAVGREREAIEMHENAARQHGEIADFSEQSASDEPLPKVRDQLRQRVADERERAAAATERAEHARKRLRDEGIDDVATQS